MKVAGITMRSSAQIASVFDSDSIEACWYEFLRACGFATLLLPNDPRAARSLLQKVQPNAIILSGGGDPACISGTVTVRDVVEIEAIQWSTQAKVPLIGVCRGMEVLLGLEGASWCKASRHAGTTHYIYGLIQRQVNSYHHFTTSGPVGAFKVLATDDHGNIECVADADRGRFGIMWHPERNKPFIDHDIALFREWLNYIWQ